MTWAHVFWSASRYVYLRNHWGFVEIIFNDCFYIELYKFNKFSTTTTTKNPTSVINNHFQLFTLLCTVHAIRSRKTAKIQLIIVISNNTSITNWFRCCCFFSSLLVIKTKIKSSMTCSHTKTKQKHHLFGQMNFHLYYWYDFYVTIILYNSISDNTRNIIIFNYFNNSIMLIFVIFKIYSPIVTMILFEQQQKNKLQKCSIALWAYFWLKWWYLEKTLFIIHFYNTSKCKWNGQCPYFIVNFKQLFEKYNNNKL